MQTRRVPGKTLYSYGNFGLTLPSIRGVQGSRKWVPDDFYGIYSKCFLWQRLSSMEVVKQVLELSPHRVSMIANRTH